MFTLTLSTAPPPELRQLHTHIIKTATPISVNLRRTAFLFAQSNPSVFPSTATSTWTSRIKSLSESGSPFEALFLFSLSSAVAVPPDKFTFSFLLKSVSLLGPPFLSIARILHAHLLKSPQFSSEFYLLNALIHAYSACGAHHHALQAFDEMPERDTVSFNTVIAALAKAGAMAQAERILSAMPAPSVRSWTAVIAGYVSNGDPIAAVRRLDDMQAAGVPPNEVTVVAGLAAAGDLGDLDLGLSLHRLSRRHGFLTNHRLCNTLIDMYVKCGCLEEARKVFDEMPERSVVTWSAMISGLAIHGHAGEAIEMFDRMVMAGVRPNGVTFLGLLQGCSHAGMVDEGRRVFDAMSEKFGIMPEIEHYGCMVDLLSRSGYLDEALEFIRGMPVPATAAVWGAVLGGARLHKSVPVAEAAIDELRRLDPTNDGYRVVLSNVYVEAGDRERAAAVRVGVTKTRGRSSVMVNGAVHVFGAGDDEHEESVAVRAQWGEMAVELRRRGYVPDTAAVLLDVPEEEKERVLFGHSEKMALTFALMKSTPGSTIRIMKNLRVCADCHKAFKLVSAMSGREIVLRDRNRFHCFKDGVCSCRDFW